MRLLPLLLALVALGSAATAAEAGCTTASGAIAFAAASSYDVLGSAVAQVAGAAGLSCSGPALSLLGGSYARATITSANGFRLSAGGGDVIPYQLSADPGGTVTFTQGVTVDYMSGTLISLLGSGSSYSAPLYARLSAAPNVAAGTYRDVLTVTWDYNICNGAQVAGVCALYETGRTSVTVNVSLPVGQDCRISAPNVAFGTAALVSQFAAVAQAALVDCTKGSAYKVAFTSGQNASARPWRVMSDHNGHSLQYNIYRPDGATIWDESNPLASAVAGTGATSPAQIQSYVARINPGQVTPVAGSYSDTVSVVISF